MGKLELAKTKAKVSMKNGKLKISKIINNKILALILLLTKDVC